MIACMSAIYLLNPDRYMHVILCREFPDFRYAWDTDYLDEHGITPEIWAMEHRVDYDEYLEGSKQRMDAVVNPPFNVAFWGQPYEGGIYDPVSIAGENEVILPTGMKVEVTSDQWHYWARKLGFKVRRLRESRKARVLFNLASIVYASTEMDFNSNLLITGRDRIRIRSPKEYKDVKDYKHFCDGCPLAAGCAYAMKGAVCTLPESDTGRFARLFGSRDSKDILTGLRMMTQANASRLETAIQAEKEDGEISKLTTQLMGQLFNQGVQLAKLLDPTLRASPKIQIGINNSAGNSEVTVASDPRQFIASALTELKGAGVPVKRITNDMLVEYMAAKESGNIREIESIIARNTVIDADESSKEVPF